MKHPEFANKQELFKWLIENEETLKDQMKAEKKEADVITFAVLQNEDINKDIKKAYSDGDTMPETSKLKLKVVINTTGLLDSHRDVHVKGLWTKSLKETKKLYLLNNHNFSFNGVLSDDIKAYVEDIPWKQLGYNAEGVTQALVFETVLDKKSPWINDIKNNEQLFELYKAGKVNNHSVGMRYVKMYLCINTQEADDAVYKDNWDKYYPEIINKEEADSKGYFWAITEAKVIEGSAVLRGSNFVTPTLENEAEQKETVEVTETKTEIVEEKKKINTFSHLM